jgi:hypothetical protein
MPAESIASSASTFEGWSTEGSSYDPDARSVESADVPILDSMHTTILELQAQFLDKNNEIAMLKLENFNLKLEHDTDVLEIALLKLEYKFDMLELQLYAMLA